MFIPLESVSFGDTPVQTNHLPNGEFVTYQQLIILTMPDQV